MLPKRTQDAIAAARTEHAAFQKAIGKFILAWADVESALYAVLRHYSGVSDAVGRAIYSGTRAGPMMTFIEAIAHNTNMETARREDLEEVFERLRTINTMRDRIVHHVDGSEQRFELEDPTRRYLTNANRVSRLGKEFVLLIGSVDIDAISADAVACCWRLVEHTEPTNDPFKCRDHLKRRAWLYTPPQPIAPPKRSAASPQPRPRQRQPSRKSPRKEE
jgi:hypothetical protein